MTEQVNPKHALPAPFETSRELELDNDRTLRDVKIMMVDDEPLNMDVLCVHLRDEGYENFVCVSEAADAISVLENEAPDVLLLDLVMPEVSGFEILTEVRKNPAFKSLPVIVLTSSDDSNTKLNALQLGASDYLAKPIDPSELALRMRNTLTARAYEQRLKYQDPLTQLPNRLLFAQRAAAAMTRARTSGYCAAIVLININRFKLINDSLGPSRGDDILWLFSQRMCQAFELDLSRGFSETAEPSRFIARIAGDRFVIMVPGVEFLSEHNEPNRSELEYDENRDKLRASIDRFFEMMEKPITVNGQDIYLNVFIGVSALSVRSFSVEHLINDAETAMLHARRRLNTKVAFYSDQMDAKAHEMLSIENGLRTAVDNKEIFVVFQPKVNMSTGRIIGAEALVRWMHPEFGLISPVDFIPLAEDTGMIVSIGEWVLREACARALEWNDYTDKPFQMAVNVSIRQLYEPDFPALVKKVLDETQLDPACLVIELTENMVMEDADSNILKLKQLKQLGLSISIDDFGTGYSALNYLQRFSLDQLKIDQSFVRPIMSLDEPQPIIRALISMAHDLGMYVVAEGVETQVQLDLLASLNCDEFQGYFCSKPIASASFLRMLQADVEFKKSA